MEGSAQTSHFHKQCLLWQTAGRAAAAWAEQGESVTEENLCADPGRAASDRSVLLHLISVVLRFQGNLIPHAAPSRG